MSRRSQRIQVLAAANTATQLTSHSLEDVKPVAKASVKAVPALPKGSAPAKLKRGSLRCMSTMSFDILVEIMAHLTPRELLSLARTSKDLRVFLMKRKSASFWKTARLNVDGLPPCPSDLCEPAYASLMYDTHCNNCAHKRCDKVHWECRLRLCPSCHDKSARPFDSFRFNLAGCPPIYPGSVLPQLRIKGTYYAKSCYYLPHAQKLDEALRAREPSERAQFLEEEERRVAELRRTGKLFERWHDKFQQAKASQQSEIREERITAVLAKLAELGYQTDIDCMTNYQYQSLTTMSQVRKPFPLSQQSWENVKPHILNFMNQIREQRLKRSRIDLMKARLEVMTKTIDELFPDFRRHYLWHSEAALGIPEIRRLVDSSHSKFSRTQLEDTLNTLLRPFAEERMRRGQEYFSNLVRDGIKLDPGVDPLSLAVGASFVRGTSGSSESFPRVLWFSHHSAIPGNDEFHDAVRESLGPGGVWTPGGYRAETERLKRYVRVCGLNPKVATMKDMDKSHIRMICPKHGTDAAKQCVYIFSWRSALVGSRCTKCKLKRAPDDQAAAAIETEAIRRAHYAQLLQSSEKSWLCARCLPHDRFGTSRLMIRSHLADVHDIDAPEEDDFLLQCESEFPTRPICLISSERKNSSEESKSANREIKRALEDHRATFFDFKSSHRWS